MEILKVENLCKTYGRGDNQVTALDHVSFSVEKGEFVAIIGPSGSGKSTLLHILGGVDTPSFGKVYIDGRDVYQQNAEQLAIFRRREVGLIYQFYNLIPVLNVVENMTLPLLLDGREINQERLEELLHTLGLEERTPAGAAVRRSAAAGVHRAGAHQRAGAGAGGRTDRQSGQPQQPGDRGAAQALQPPVSANAADDHPRRAHCHAG